MLVLLGLFHVSVCAVLHSSYTRQDLAYRFWTVPTFPLGYNHNILYWTLKIPINFRLHLHKGVPRTLYWDRVTTQYVFTKPTVIEGLSYRFSTNRVMGIPDLTVVPLPHQMQWLRHESVLVILTQNSYTTTQIITVMQIERMHIGGIEQMLYSTAKRKLLRKPWQNNLQLHPNKGCSSEVVQTGQTNRSVHDRSTDEMCNGDM
jgi:hypothetical protein